jgi:glutathione peroxidase-family protein
MHRNWEMPTAAALIALTAPAAAAVQNGALAPDFTLTDIKGKPVSLSAFRGRTVVLEWNNLKCPYSLKHYSIGNMQKTQAAARQAGAVWLTINSEKVAPGAVKTSLGLWNAQPTSYLLDPTGKVGKTFGAKTTPHLIIIDRNGRLVYQGSIDDKPTLDPSDVAIAKNYVLTALREMRSGKRVSSADTRPYGCPISYSS